MLGTGLEFMTRIVAWVKSLPEKYHEWTFKSDMGSMHKAMMKLPESTRVGVTPVDNPEIVTVCSSEPDIVGMLISVATIASLPMEKRDGKEAEV